MARSPHQEAPGLNPVWLGLVKFLILVASMVFLFAMGESMVHHHFFSGGVLNYQLSTPHAGQ